MCVCKMLREWTTVRWSFWQNWQKWRHLRFSSIGPQIWKTLYPDCIWLSSKYTTYVNMVNNKHLFGSQLHIYKYNLFSFSVLTVCPRSVRSNLISSQDLKIPTRFPHLWHSFQGFYSQIGPDQKKTGYTDFPGFNWN